jgi:succinyl-diaminopimelate desuccinylase
MDVRVLAKAVASDEKHMVDSLCSMLRINAVGPIYGGPGEAERGEFLTKLCKDLGFKSIEVIESKDPAAKAGKRPNIIVRVKGSSDKNIWVVTHMDTVPEGDLSAWKSPPFDPKVKDGRIFGRGAEDNGQELIATMFGLSALIHSGVTPEANIGLVMVSDEEHGNVHGIEFLLKKGIFKKGDMAVVPDHGGPDGATLCIVEKGIAWINVEVIGRQTHASTPNKGINALEVSARFMVEAVDLLRKKYGTCDPMFDPPCSTFEPTKCDANGPNVNTVPGKQQFAFDFRVLPDYRLDDVMADLKATAKKFEESAGVTIHLTYLQKTDSAPKTNVDSEIVLRLSKAIQTVKGARAHAVGIGGGTCANPFRREGIDAVVWSTIRETAHDANEYIEIANMVSDAQVYAALFAGKNVQS